MNLLTVEKKVESVFLYKGELVKVYSNKISIGSKVITAEPTDVFVCENDLLIKTENCGKFNQQKFYIYDGDSFVSVTSRYDHHQSFHHYYSPDSYCFVIYDNLKNVFKVAFYDHGTEYQFDYGCDTNLFDFDFNQKHEVLIMEHMHRYLFFSKTGEKLWEIVHTEDFSTVYNIEGFESDSDGFILKVNKNQKQYTVCYNVRTGEVMWEHEDIHPLILTGNKCDDGVYRNLLGYNGNSALLFEMDSSNGDTKAYILKEGEGAKVFDKKLEEQTVCYATNLQGDKLYFSKNYNNYLLGDARERTIGVVDLKTKQIQETECVSGFCYLSAPILFENNLYVFIKHISGDAELMCFDQTNDKSDEENETLPKQAGNNYENENDDPLRALQNLLSQYQTNNENEEVGEEEEVVGVDELASRVEKDDRDAIMKLAECYYLGEGGLEADEEKAFERLRYKISLENLTDCECIALEGDAIEKYFEYREQGKKEGFIPVVVSYEELYIDSLKDLLGCGGEESPAKIKETVKAYHEKMLAVEVEDGKAYLDKSYVDADWDEAEFKKNTKHTDQLSPFMNRFVVKVPVTEPWRIWAYLPYGNWNACPEVSKHMAVSKYWYEQYGAYPAAFSGTRIDYAVEKPIKDCKELVKEMGGYCYDIIEQGFDTYSALAAEVKNAKIWNFWWD